MKAVPRHAGALVVMLAFAATTSVADVLSEWTFENLNPPQAEMQIADGGVFGGFMRRTHADPTSSFFNPAGNGSPRGWSSSSWTTGDTIEIWSGSLTYQNIRVEWDQARNSGPATFDLDYTTDGVNYHAVLDNYSVLNNGSPNAAWSSASPRNSAYTRSVLLPAGAADQGNLVIRLVAQESSFAGSIVVDNITVSGTPIPEPHTAALFAMVLLGAIRRR